MFRSGQTVYWEYNYNGFIMHKHFLFVDVLLYSVCLSRKLLFSADLDLEFNMSVTDLLSLIKMVFLCISFQSLY